MPFRGRYPLPGGIPQYQRQVRYGFTGVEGRRAAARRMLSVFKANMLRRRRFRNATAIARLSRNYGREFASQQMLPYMS